ncbi:SAM-dependent methyltransferase [Roseospira visakhapatnamensis]|uniref:Cyclopropane fatty-acyl-phospholipid synthase-like methyltransferase n=1 Tax=Roseospira visakhapatnamensis TaxID=390880 RepID=A0A7W6R9I7_9PROT|nr:class I SAM-dependent methyltransferase [Roseospira visakhapatnamensis]MBB4264414.1 cyclopropane fatty-acyl-phospholipid synthase-like methyltransferase [Roseospira visakhapatnamensis]
MADGAARRPRRRHLGADPAAWDEAYRAGDFARLHGLGEAPRYGIIAAWLRHLVPDGGTVLDAGCGEGALFRHVVGERPSLTYIGFDLSAVALETAARMIGTADAARARLRRAGLADYRPAPEDPPYDAIVLTEVLSYSADSITWLDRYRRWLAPEGVMVATLQVPRRPDSGAHGPFNALRAALDGPAWTVLDSADLTSPRGGNAWVLRVFR